MAPPPRESMRPASLQAAKEAVHAWRIVGTGLDALVRTVRLGDPSATGLARQLHGHWTSLTNPIIELSPTAVVVEGENAVEASDEGGYWILPAFMAGLRKVRLRAESTSDDVLRFSHELAMLKPNVPVIVAFRDWLWCDGAEGFEVAINQSFVELADSLAMEGSAHDVMATRSTTAIADWNRLSQIAARELDAAAVREEFGVPIEIFQRKASSAEFRLADVEAEALRRAGDDASLWSEAELHGLRFRELPYAQYGEEAEHVDATVFTAAQVALAIGEAERARMESSAHWPWALGVSIVRRLERGLETDRDGTHRAMECAPGAWTPPRRAVSAALQTMSLLTSLDLTRFARRAAAHASLALASIGYREREGRPCAEAATETLRSLLAAPVTAQSGVDPHRLRVCTMLHAMCAPGTGASAGTGTVSLTGLLAVTYELERRRCPAGVSFDLTRLDLMADAVRAMGTDLDATWVRALVGDGGAVPVGAYVLADGRLGIVIESAPADDPWRPKVLIGGDIVVPKAPVILHSPLATR